MKKFDNGINRSYSRDNLGMQDLRKEVDDKKDGKNDGDKNQLLKYERKRNKFRMKLEKLVLTQNEQDEDGLKHIFTLLISNQKLFVDIDLPKYEDRICKVESDSSEEEETPR